MWDETEFGRHFVKLTGQPGHFPWQWRLYQKLAEGSAESLPTTCALPTGLGKTSVVALWLLALASGARRLPRRLVYVVNRRTVVDQTTSEVERLRANLEVAGLKDSLQSLLGSPTLPDREDEPLLGLSTLRGQFADNQQWSLDPARPAVIVGTVDMIGSRLLFQGYRAGFKTRPLHAGFLGQNALLVHDEAHLEPAFQSLLTQVVAEQRRCRDLCPLWVMELSATPRSAPPAGALSPPVFTLEAQDRADPVVARRIQAPKKLSLREAVGKTSLPDQLADQALAYRGQGRTVLVYVEEVKHVKQIVERLQKAKQQQVQQLTGTLRGWERDQLLDDAVFARFLPGLANRLDGPEVALAEETAYLVCTSAGEVGINLSADHLVCDLTPWDRMAQRFGRVNRFGEQTDTEIHVFPRNDYGATTRDEAKQRTLALLHKLEGDASPEALRRVLETLSLDERTRAFSPAPQTVPTSEILFDAWALTSIRDMLPGRPPVEPYLHGVSEYEPPETQVAWREEVGHIQGDAMLVEYPPEEVLAAYPLKPHELLRDETSRVYDELKRIAKRHPDQPAWLVAGDGSVQPVQLGELLAKGADERLRWKTVLLPPQVGGLGIVSGRCTGQLAGAAEFEPALAKPQPAAADGQPPPVPVAGYDIADLWFDERGQPRRVRVRNDDRRPPGMRAVLTLDFSNPDQDEAEANTVDIQDDQSASSPGLKVWYWWERPRESDGEESRSATRAIPLNEHLADVERETTRLVQALELPEEIQRPLVLAARFHDLGKNRRRWQRGIGNFGDEPLAKSAGGRRYLERTDLYRHEFGSLLDAHEREELSELSDEARDLLLHVLAAHHGRARPHFTLDEAFDPEPRGRDQAAVLAEVPRRFARLQRRYGRWGLAYLESLLRAADYAASANPTCGEQAAGDTP